jgi:hypothetical protein
MNWKDVAIDDLERFERQKQALANISARLDVLEDCYTSLKSVATDKTPVQGGSTPIEDKLLSNLVERERLKHTYKATKKLVELTEKGLGRLNEDEKRTLELFFIHRHKYHVERLMEELGYEKTRIYSLKDSALYKFTISMYGLPEY